MRLVTRAILALTVFAPLVLSACGNRPADQAAAPVAATPAPAAAAPAPATPPPSDQVAQAETPAPPPAAKPKPKPAATQPPAAKPPSPPPKPEPIVKTVPAATDLEVELVEGASSATSQVGNPVKARLTRGIVIDSVVVIPAGAIIGGTVTEAVSVKKIGGTASLGLRFDTLELSGGRKMAIAASLKEQGKSEDGKDAGTIAGATAGGALLGRLLSKNDKTKGTLIGAVVGAAAGTGIAAATKGQQVELPAGTPLVLHLEQPVIITVEP